MIKHKCIAILENGTNEVIESSRQITFKQFKRVCMEIFKEEKLEYLEFREIAFDRG